MCQSAQEAQILGIWFKSDSLGARLTTGLEDLKISLNLNGSVILSLDSASELWKTG